MTNPRNHWQNKWRRWRELKGPDRRIFLKAYFLLPLFNLALRIVKFQTFYKILQKITPVSTSPVEPTIEEAISLATVVKTAGRNSPFEPSCLHKSLLTWTLLRSKGMESTIWIGVGKQDAEFAAHSWVEVRGIVIDDDQDVTTRYTTMPIDLS